LARDSTGTGFCSSLFLTLSSPRGLLRSAVPFTAPADCVLIPSDCSSSTPFRNFGFRASALFYSVAFWNARPLPPFMFFRFPWKPCYRGFPDFFFSLMHWPRPIFFGAAFLSRQVWLPSLSVEVFFFPYFVSSMSFFFNGQLINSCRGKLSLWSPPPHPFLSSPPPRS